MRIAIVNDLMPAVETLRRTLQEVPGCEIAWIAQNGLEAVEKCAADVPDLILMDLLMPVMDGAESTRKIMQESPCPILVVTSTVDKNVAKVFEAMGQGALDAVNLPTLGHDAEAQKSRAALLKKIRTVCKLRGLPSYKEKIISSPSASQVNVPTLIAIGSSTGGPKALAEVLSRVQTTCEAALVIVQHVDESFSSGLVKWLSYQSPLPVELAVRGRRPEKGRVYIAGTNDHLVLTSGLTFSYTAEPIESVYRPSVDAFFLSIAAHWPNTGMALLLTGMGRDGASGLAVLRKKGWHTVAQDESTSVVYGMPKAARELNAAVEILPIDKIGPAIMNFLRKKQGAKA